MKGNHAVSSEEEKSAATLGGLLGAFWGMGYSASTGALQAFWASQAAQLASVSAFFSGTPVLVVLPVMIPTLTGAAVGGGVAYTGYQIYRVFVKPGTPAQNIQQNNSPRPNG